MDINITNPKSGKNVCALTELSGSKTILDIKEEISILKGNLDINRIQLKADVKGKALKDEDSLEKLCLKSGDELYFKDLGLQIGWKTVFLIEYFGPLVLYLWTYSRPSLLYGDSRATHKSVVHIAAGCWALHFTKRLLETLFVHRFSHATMPFTNLFKNCGYYWLFAVYVGYHVNHPLYTSPGQTQIIVSLIGFLVCQLGNFSIHLSLRNLRPPGTKERRIPHSTSNPLTYMFQLVSCPNYTYEVGSWVFFTLMTQCLPAGMFTLAGLYQMTIWALGKHKNYRKEFDKYPRGRKAIIPFII